ncbi:MAG: hypothetical protein PHG25_03190 [Candidatus Pacebacteria bacterium]|nr:hypothetical protein [Candidatus Paceibacterota bacterium]
MTTPLEKKKPVTKVATTGNKVTFTVSHTGAQNGIAVALTKDAVCKANAENHILSYKFGLVNPGQPYSFELTDMERIEKMAFPAGAYYLHFVTLGDSKTTVNSDVLSRKIVISAQLANRFELMLMSIKISKLAESVKSVPTLVQIADTASAKIKSELDKIKADVTQAAITGSETSVKQLKGSIEALEKQIRELVNKPAPTVDNTNVDKVKADLLKLEQQVKDLANMPAPQPAAPVVPAANAPAAAPTSAAPAAAATTTTTATPATATPSTTTTTPPTTATVPAEDYSRETTILKWALAIFAILVLAGLGAWLYCWAHPHNTVVVGGDNTAKASAIKPESTSEASVGTTTNGYGAAISQNGSASNFGNSNSFSNCSNNQVQIIGVQNNAFVVPETHVTYTNIIIEAPRQPVPPPTAPDQTEHQQNDDARYLGKVDAGYQQQVVETRVVGMVSQPYTVFDIGFSQPRQQRLACKQVVCDTRRVWCNPVPVCINNPPPGWTTTRPGSVIDNSPGQNQGYAGNMGFQAQNNQRVAQTPSRRESGKGMKLASNGGGRNGGNRRN